MKCPRCQQESPAGQKFCGECGSPLKRISETGPQAASYADLQRALTEALEQQTATSEILRVISSSPTDLQPILDAVAQSAARLCEADDATISLREGDELRSAVHVGPIPPSRGIGSRSPINRHWVSGRALLDGQPVHVHDLAAAGEFPESQARALAAGFRTILAVPLLREGKAIGAIAIRRAEVRPFSDKHIALLQTFADQAVIAIENVRLFEELEAKNRALTQAHAQVTESLEQQTATSEILRVIASSPTDLQPVLDAVAHSAAQLCEAEEVVILRIEGDRLHRVAAHGPWATGLDLQRGFPLDRGSVSGRSVVDRRTLHIDDLAAEPESEFPQGRELQRRFGHRTMLASPLLRQGEAVGTICIFRLQVRPFTDKQVSLLQTFADQAVIAIENVRLFTELQARNRDLTDALERQTATAELLRVISRSQTEVQPVFDTIADSAMRLLRAWSVVVGRFDGELIHLAAVRGGAHEPDRSILDHFPTRPTSGLTLGRCLLERSVIQIIDVETEAEPVAATREMARARGWRSALAVPMLRDGQPIGAIMVTRAEVGGFGAGSVELLQTFADQAVIAIENVRLFKELEARTGELTQSVEKLTALGEVSRAVSSTLDVETVLNTIVSRAGQLSGADGCSIYEYNEATEEFQVRATHNLDAAIVETLRMLPLRKGEGLMGRAAGSREPTQIPDIAQAGAYQSRIRDLLIGAGYRALLSVPLLREDQVIGSLSFNRKAPGVFPPEVVDVLNTFATQSALAIQNARLFREIADKSRQLELASQHKSEFLANMSHELRTPLNAILGFSEALTERMFGDLNEKQEEYLRDIYASGQHLLSLINDILDLSKIEAGRMELELTDFDLPQAIENALTLVRERAERRGIALHEAVDQRLGQIRGDERKIKQVLLNLLSNALKFTPGGGRVDVRASVVDGMAEISVTDTGVGIASEDQEAVFEEFRQVGTAAKQGEGTGLGLALSRRFIELHGGRIWVKSQVGKGSTFTFTIPILHS